MAYLLPLVSDLREISVVTIRGQVEIEFNFNFAILLPATKNFSRDDITSDGFNAAGRNIHGYRTNDFVVGYLDFASERNLEACNRELVPF